jgi:hypothetical protein
MPIPATHSVIAGSKGFAAALLAPLTERVGAPPRIAVDPAQAVALCRGAGLVVIEFQGEGSLRAIEQIASGGGVRIVAAVPAAHAAAEAPLRALGVDPARWDGKPDRVLGAVSRQLSAASGAAAAAPPPAPVPAPRPAAGVHAQGRAPMPRAPAERPAPPSAPPARPTAARPAPAIAAKPPAPAPPRPVVAPPPAPRVAPAAGSATGVAAALFDDVFCDLDVEVSEAPSVPVDVAAPLAPPPAAGPWPGGVPGALDAAQALGRGLAGAMEGQGTLGGAVASVLGSLSDLERAVLAGEPQAVDAEPIRRAAVMRVRVAAAVATAPAPGGEIDEAAVSSFLAEIDGILSDVGALAQAAPAELQPSLEAVRNALVTEAIDLSDVAHRLAPAGGDAPAVQARPAVRAPQARMLSVSAAEKVERPRSRALWIALGVAVAFGAAAHGPTLLRRLEPPAPRPPTLAGAPSGTAARPSAHGGPQIVLPGERPAGPAELERFRLEQGLMGNEVQEVGGGALLVRPKAAGAGQ